MPPLLTLTIPPQTLPSDRQPVLVYLASLAPSSRRTMRTALETIASMLGYADALECPWHQLKYQHTAAIRAAIMGQYAPTTANRMLAALRRVLLECRRLELMSADDHARAADIAHIPGDTLPPGRALSSDELAALMQACLRDPSPAGARDAALIATLARAGLRRSEAAALQLADVDLASGALTIRTGKGRQQRITYLAGGAVAAMRAWCAVRGDAPGALFCPVDKSQQITIRSITHNALVLMIQKRALQAGIAPFSPHDLRRTFISDLLDAGADIVTVQRMVGHRSPATTSRYDRRGEATKRAASALLHLPYPTKP